MKTSQNNEYRYNTVEFLQPNYGPLPKHYCKECQHYYPGGICDLSMFGTTSALENADLKPCFEPRGQDGYRLVSASRPKQICPDCGRTLLLSRFPLVGGHPSQICEDCLSKHQKNTEAERAAELDIRWENWSENRKKMPVLAKNPIPRKKRGVKPISEIDGMRLCKECGVWKPVEQYGVTKNGRRYYICKSCLSKKRSACGKLNRGIKRKRKNDSNDNRAVQ